MAFKSGFVNIIGNPNVGKSTLLNALLGERLSIITPKAQTTRHRIFGILNNPKYQVVFSDTPGVIKPAYALQESMMKEVRSAFEDADIFLYLVEPGMKALKDEHFFQQLLKAQVPVLLVLNKIDLLDQEKLEKATAYWKDQLPNAEVIPLSALHKFHTDYLMQRILALLPEGEPYFDQEAITDRSERFVASEMIREQLLLNYEKEIPYSTEVVIEEFKDEPNILRIRATIYVARDSQKGIIIGKAGAALKKTAAGARKGMEDFFQKQVFLQVFVKVSKDWRDKSSQLKRFGYQ